MNIDVVPRPHAIHRDVGHIRLAKRIGICTSSDCDDLSKLAALMASEITSLTGVQLADHSAWEGPSSDVSVLRVVLSKDDAPANSEGYEVSIRPCEMYVRAMTVAGLYYGWQTLKQLIYQAFTSDSADARDALAIQCIRDQPRFAWRGLMLDSARTCQPVAVIRRIIDLMACLKLNIFHWHFTDDSRWAIESRRYPGLSGAVWGEGDDPKGATYYTQDEIRGVVQYAKDRCITVVPEIEMPGHCTCVLNQYPDYACFGKPTGSLRSGTKMPPLAVKERKPYCVGNSRCVEFLEGILGEIAELFETPYIHIGGDERPAGIWTNCPRCSGLMRQLELNDENALQNWFMRHMAHHIHERLGRTSMAWAENLGGGVPEGQIIQSWREGECEQAVSQGARVVNSLHSYTYLDYPQTMKEAEAACDWMQLLSLDKVYQFDPVPQGVSADQRSLVLGGEAAVWTTFIPDERLLYHHVLPRLLAFSEVVWSPVERRCFEDFKSRLAVVRRMLHKLGLWV